MPNTNIHQSTSGIEPPAPLLLASGSRYRRTILAKVFDTFAHAAPDIDESPCPGEKPGQLAMRLAAAKAEALRDHYPDHWIIGSDQVAVCADQRLGKPGNVQSAIQQLTMASGRSVTFLTAVSLLTPQSGHPDTSLDLCTVYFRHLTLQQIHRYVELDQPLDCAGSFRSEGLGITLVEKIEGDDPNALVGLPLIKLLQIMARHGCNVP